MPYMPTVQIVDLRGAVPSRLQFGSALTREGFDMRMLALRATLRRGEHVCNVGAVINRTTLGPSLVEGQRVTADMLLPELDRDRDVVASPQERFAQLVRSGEILAGI